MSHYENLASWPLTRFRPTGFFLVACEVVHLSCTVTSVPLKNMLIENLMPRKVCPVSETAGLGVARECGQAASHRFCRAKPKSAQPCHSLHMHHSFAGLLQWIVYRRQTLSYILLLPHALSPFSLLTLQEGNINLINAAKKAGIKKFILVSPFNPCLSLMRVRIGKK
jgi:hypothetical protein